MEVGRKEANEAHGEGSARHVRTPEYTTRINLIARCENPTASSFPLYGGRGIRVCERWRKSFVAFLEDMGRRPSPTHSIDRIDTNGDYEPANCRWATQREQAQNKQNNHKLTANGETLCLSEWQRRTGLSKATIQNRIAKGLPAEDVVRPTARVEFRGESIRMAELARRFGISSSTLHRRIHRYGMSPEDAVQQGIRRPT